MELEEIDDPRTLWSALVRAELSDADPRALERALEAIADYPLPPRQEPEALELSPELTTRIPGAGSWRSGPRRCFRSGYCGSWQVRQGPPAGAMGAANRTDSSLYPIP